VELVQTETRTAPSGGCCRRWPARHAGSAAPFLLRLACTAATALANLAFETVSVPAALATLLLAAVAAVHAAAVVALGRYIGGGTFLGDKGALLLGRTMLVFAASVDYGICAIKAVAAACTAVQLHFAACGREFLFVLSVSLCAATLLVGSHHGDWGLGSDRSAEAPARRVASGAIRSQFGQFCAIPLVVALCSVDATSSLSPQVVVFCGIVSSFVVVSSGASYAVERDGAEAATAARDGGQANPLSVDAGPRNPLHLAYYRRPMHPKAV
jgi:hypothetical protein